MSQTSNRSERFVDETDRFVDCHAHVFPSTESGSAWQRAVANDDPKRTGALDEFQRIIDDAGIARAVMLLYPRAGLLAEKLRKQGFSDDEVRAGVRSEFAALNEWGCRAATADRRLIPFIGINPLYMTPDEIDAEISKCHVSGAQGVKILLSDMELYADDPLLWPVYRSCSRLGLPILSQSGMGLGLPSPENPFGRPIHFAKALQEFPGLHVILAHLAKGFETELRDLMAAFTTLYTDTSLRLSQLGGGSRWTEESLVDFFRCIGTDRVLFGTNYPFVNPAAYVSRLSTLPLLAGERRHIAGGNFEHLLTRAREHAK